METDGADNVWEWLAIDGMIAVAREGRGPRPGDHHHPQREGGQGSVRTAGACDGGTVADASGGDPGMVREGSGCRGGWSDVVKQVFLPVEKVYKVANGKKVVRERNYYPGYVMIEIIDGRLSDDLRDTIKNTNSVIHFLGKENPIALRKAEVNKMLGKMDEMAESGGVSMVEPFIVGETIKIIEGPFNDFNGVIEEVNDEKKKLKVTVKIFGRSTPVELNYMQVEKIS
jgi:transcriptional antiterminator NusG